MNGTASLSNGILTISATNRSSTIRVGEQNGRFVIQGDPTAYRASAVREVVVNGMGDHLIWISWDQFLRDMDDLTVG